MVHGGLLALRDKPDHAAAMKSHGIEGIDLLVCNLYPFEATVARGADFLPPPGPIDIGGPASGRSTAKNHDWVTVVVDVEDYKPVLDEMAANGGATTLALRRTLAQRAFARTAAYDAAVSNWFAGELEKSGDKTPPRRRSFGGLLRQPLRYGRKSAPGAPFMSMARPRPWRERQKQTDPGQGRNFPTTISATPTRPMSWWRVRFGDRPGAAPSSSTPIPAALALESSLKDTI